MERNEDVCERIYQNALLLIEGRLFSEAADELGRIPGYRDADELRTECEQKKVTKRLDEVYEEADKAAANRNVRSQEKAIQIFQKIPGYRDADQRVEQARRAIEEIVARERADRAEAIRAAKERELKRRARIRRIVRIAVIAVLAAALCGVGAFLYKKYAVPELRYRRGVNEMEAGAYEDAYRTLHGMNYKDSADLIFRIGRERLQSAEPGDVVLFGAYPQGHIVSEEKDPVEWLVLDKNGTTLTLISKYALDALPYMKYTFEKDHTPVSWRTSLLRSWLNGTFLETAFDPGEVRMLKYVKLKNGEGSSDTTDRVYLLSLEEAETCFAAPEDRKCVATQFALEFGAYRSSIEPTCLWWLRTPIYSESNMAALRDDDDAYMTYRIACIGTSGQIVDVGHNLICLYGVRPVIQVDTEGAEGLTFKKIKP